MKSTVDLIQKKDSCGSVLQICNSNFLPQCSTTRGRLKWLESQSHPNQSFFHTDLKPAQIAQSNVFSYNKATLKLKSRNSSWLDWSIKRIVHPKNKHLLTILFTLKQYRIYMSLSLLWSRIYLYITCSSMDPLQWMGAIRIRGRTADENVTIIYTTTVH